MIECNLVGRAGNQMFEYAMCRTLGEAKGFDWCINPAQWVCNDLFNLSFGGRGGEPITKEYHETILEYDPRIWDIEDGTLINGYFQSEQYFDNAKARKWFKLYPERSRPERFHLITRESPGFHEGFEAGRERSQDRSSEGIFH